MSFVKECLDGHDVKNKLINCISIGTLTIAFMFLLVFFYWSLWPYNPLDINERPIKLQNKEISKSSKEPLVYMSDVCKNSDIIPLVKRRFSDGLEYQLPEIRAFSKETGCRVYNIALDIPHNLPEGEYILILEFEYDVNPIRKVTVKTHTEKFKVIE